MTEFELDVRWSAPGFDLQAACSWDAPVCAVFGPSGAGKSTLLEVLAGVRRGARGRASLAGQVLFDGAAWVPPERRGLGWVPQDGALFPHLTAGGNMRFGLARGGAGAREALDRAMAMLEIGHLQERPVSALSGGERQRVALARAIASGARALLLDEPLAALDRPLRARLVPWLAKLRDELRLPMIYVTHDPHEVLALAGHVLVLQAGRLVAAGPPRTVLWSALQRFDFGGGLAPLENRLQGSVVAAEPDGVWRILLDGGGELLAPAPHIPGARRVVVSFRADDVILALGPTPGLSALNVLPATVTAVEWAEDAAYVQLAAPAPLLARLTRRAAQRLALEKGSSVHAILKSQAIHLEASA